MGVSCDVVHVLGSKRELVDRGAVQFLEQLNWTL